jgi:hypothetical protein
VSTLDDELGRAAYDADTAEGDRRGFRDIRVPWGEATPLSREMYTAIAVAIRDRVLEGVAPVLKAAARVRDADAAGEPNTLASAREWLNDRVDEARAAGRMPK